MTPEYLGHSDCFKNRPVSKGVQNIPQNRTFGILVEMTLRSSIPCFTNSNAQPGKQVNC